MSLSHALGAEAETRNPHCIPVPSSLVSFVSETKNDLAKTTGLYCRDFAISMIPMRYGELGPALSSTWAQEFIGSDLAKDFVDFKYGEQGVATGLIDQGLHREVVQALATSNSPLSASSKLSADPPTRYLPVKNGSTQEFIDVLERMKQAQQKIVNVSMEYERPAPEAVKNAVEQLAQSSILVMAAGNSGRKLIHQTNVFEGNGAITVGSLSPSGFVSHFSSGKKGEGVTIFAPSDHFIESPIHMSHQTKNFGGTSGAAPLVSGSLKNVLRILPDLSPAEAKLLLQKTAVPMPPDQVSAGKGMVNAFKLVKVADKLRKAGWPKNRQKLLDNVGLFDFSQEAKTLYKKATALVAKGGCENLQAAFDLNRQSFLLNPTAESADAWIHLNLSQNKTMNANFLQNMKPGASAADREASFRTLAFHDHPNIRLAALRAAAEIDGEKALPLFKKALRQEPGSTEQILFASAGMGKSVETLLMPMVEAVRDGKAKNQDLLVAVASRADEELGRKTFAHLVSAGAPPSGVVTEHYLGSNAAPILVQSLPGKNRETCTRIIHAAPASVPGSMDVFAAALQHPKVADECKLHAIVAYRSLGIAALPQIERNLQMANPKNPSTGYFKALSDSIKGCSCPTRHGFFPSSLIGSPQPGCYCPQIPRAIKDVLQ